MRHKFQNLITESKGDERFKKILANGSDENFRWAYQFAYERAYGKAPQAIQHSGEINGTQRMVLVFPTEVKSE